MLATICLCALLFPPLDLPSLLSEFLSQPPFPTNIHPITSHPQASLPMPGTWLPEPPAHLSPIIKHLSFPVHSHACSHFPHYPCQYLNQQFSPTSSDYVCFDLCACYLQVVACLLVCPSIHLSECKWDPHYSVYWSPFTEPTCLCGWILLAVAATVSNFNSFWEWWELALLKWKLMFLSLNACKYNLPYFGVKSRAWLLRWIHFSGIGC